MLVNICILIYIYKPTIIYLTWIILNLVFDKDWNIVYDCSL